MSDEDCRSGHSDGRGSPLAEPVLVTKRGQPIAQVVPPPPPEASAFGCMRGTAREVGDLLALLPEEDWEALR